MTEIPPVAPAAKASPPPLPRFFAAWRGVWLLTWKAQLTWRRLPLRLAALLALPALVLLTTRTPASWGRWEAKSFVSTLDRRLSKPGSRLSPDQQKKLNSIVAEQYAQAAAQWQEQPGESAEERRQRWREELGKCGDRIVAQARESRLVDGQQLAAFKAVEEEHRRGLKDWNRTASFYHWLVDFYIFLIVPLACVRGCGALIRDELQAETLGFLITRPVSRARLLLLKYLSHVAWLELLLMVETLLLFAAGAAREIPALGVLLPLVLAVQSLAIPAWSALGVLLGQLTSRYMAAALVYGGVVEMGIGRIPTNINTLSLMRHIKTLLSHNVALQGLYDWPEGRVATALLALAVAPVLFMAVSALLFTYVEYHHAAEMQK
jgi:hypothetical protein